MISLRNSCFETIVSKETFPQEVWKHFFRGVAGARNGRCPGQFAGRSAWDDVGMRITAVTSTDLFTGTARRPLQIIQVSLSTDTADAGQDVHVRVDGAGVSTPAPCRVLGGPPGAALTAEVPVEIAAPFQPGVPRPVTAVAETGTSGAPQRTEFPAQVTPAEP